MFTSILRIGPLVILEALLLAIATVVYCVGTLPHCYHYTLSQLAFILFLLETFSALRIIKYSAPLRRRYLKCRIEEPKPRFYTRLLWDNLNLMLVTALLYSALVADGLRLTNSTPVESSSAGSFGESSGKEC